VDTNILVSAALKPDGLQRTVLLLTITKPARLYVSTAILTEYRDVLSRPELQIRKGLRQQLLNLIAKRARSVTPARQIDVTKDPDDNIFLECADAARADYWEHAAFPEVLEEDQDHHIARVSERGSPASPHVT
jgi:putative PIN family toxin of toxin-antitoxin system